MRFRNWFLRLIDATLLFLAAACGAADAEPAYVWRELTRAAAFPPSYNFPVHVARDGGFVALHPRGTFGSRDGAEWMLADLPPSGLNSAYLAFVAHEGGAYSLGRHEGNYLKFTIDPIILRTDDYRSWRDLGRSASLPKVVFYAAASFDGFLWILGGYDGAGEVGDVWRSRDGLAWEKLIDAAPFGPRMGAEAIAFRGRLYLIGGGELDGPSRNDVWSSADGRSWRLETASLAPEAPVGFTPVVFDEKLWLVGANRSGSFRSEMLVSDDGRSFTPVRAPWSPRGGVAAWTDGEGLYVTGGKFSTGEGENIKFIYSNDVWVMRKEDK